eukprot:TRINITY_DN20517_c0_g1_i3.p1 TRINITY_DN20517_c0_g1~~TRINITY_DN20517_c0_g1_i3.p1  ORF type:complete len:292 (-),score=60.01 TRINITY_DN20517_c0_g1_i3:158-1033(-)
MDDLRMEYLFLSDFEAGKILIEWMEKRDLDAIKTFLKKYRSRFLLRPEGTKVFCNALIRGDLIALKVLVDHGCSPLLNEGAVFEHSGRLEEALSFYQEHVSFLDESVEQVLAQSVIKHQVAFPTLAGKYRVMAKLALKSRDFESFSRLADKAWAVHCKGYTDEFEFLFWTKGTMLQRRGKHLEAFSVFESLAAKSSPFYTSRALYELGLFEEAFCCLKDLLLGPSEVLYLAQASLCLMRLRDVGLEARNVYHRLKVLTESEVFESQGLSALEVDFVKRILRRLPSFLAAHP